VGTDSLGRSTSASSTFTALVSPPPAPTITSQPANPTNSTSASFGFTDPQSGVTFQCSRDGAAFTACTSPTSYTGLAAGAHTFSVQAKDSFGALSTATTVSWTVDTTAPTATDVQTTNGGTANVIDTGDKLTFSFSEPIAPGSVKSGWTGGSTAVTVHVALAGQNANLTVTGTNLGTVKLDKAYASATFDTAATIELVGNAVVVTITQSNAGATAGGVEKMAWTLGTGLTDLAGNGVTTTAVTEGGQNDADF